MHHIAYYLLVSILSHYIAHIIFWLTKNPYLGGADNGFKRVGDCQEETVSILAINSLFQNAFLFSISLSKNRFSTILPSEVPISLTNTTSTENLSFI